MPPTPRNWNVVHTRSSKGRTGLALCCSDVAGHAARKARWWRVQLLGGLCGAAFPVGPVQVLDGTKISVFADQKDGDGVDLKLTIDIVEPTDSATVGASLMITNPDKTWSLEAKSGEGQAKKVVSQKPSCPRRRWPTPPPVPPSAPPLPALDGAGFGPQAVRRAWSEGFAVADVPARDRFSVRSGTT